MFKMHPQWSATGQVNPYMSPPPPMASSGNSYLNQGPGVAQGVARYGGQAPSGMMGGGSGYNPGGGYNPQFQSQALARQQMMASPVQGMSSGMAAGRGMGQSINPYRTAQMQSGVMPGRPLEQNAVQMARSQPPPPGQGPRPPMDPRMAALNPYMMGQ